MLDMSETKVKIIEAAINQFTRYGIKRVSMSDVADAADVSRQTLYSHFKNKELLVAEAMQVGIGMIFKKLEAAWNVASTKEEMIDAFLEICVLKPFETLLQNPDLSDLQQGIGKATYEIAKEHEAEKIGLLASQLEEFEVTLASKGTSPQELAEFVVRTTTDMKYSTKTTDALQVLLKTLRASILSLLKT